jgi:hypothetical protein
MRPVEAIPGLDWRGIREKERWRVVLLLETVRGNKVNEPILQEAGILLC